MKMNNNNNNDNNNKGMTSVSVPAEYSVRSWISIRRKECYQSQYLSEDILFF
jgi:hypothetical protein